MIDTKALRQKILDLAIRGKLVPQDPDDEPASVLLERIRQQKQQMVKEGKLKPKDIKNDSVIFVGEDNSQNRKVWNCKLFVNAERVVSSCPSRIPNLIKSFRQIGAGYTKWTRKLPPLQTSG